MEHKKYLNIIEEKDCIGCSACYNKCPVNAITMEQNDEGFYVPIVDTQKCTNCGLCKKVCPNINVKYKNKKNAKCYAAMADNKIRIKSSSGGIFNLLASYILENDGYVCGALFDKNTWFVEHKIIDNKDELIKLQKSKYVQSKLGDCYKELEVLLKNNKLVLFSGTPCQVAGLYTYLNKEYNNLFTIDLVCHGVPSSKVFNDFIKQFGDLEDINAIDFREKEIRGWSTSTTIKFKNKETYSKGYTECDYFRGFQYNLFLNKHCTNCKYSKIPRQADISLGDFWGIMKFNPKYNDKKGTSIVVSNNAKGDFLLEQIKDKTILFKEVNFLKAIKKSNPNLNCSFKEHKNRDLFFKLYKELGFKKAFEYAIDDKFDICLINNSEKDKIGSLLNKFTLLTILEKLTNRICILNDENVPNDEIKFLEKYFTCINYTSSDSSAIEINYKSKKFIWTGLIAHKSELLTQIFDNKIKILFGSKILEYNKTTEKKEIDELIYHLSKFSNLSISEKENELFDEYKIKYENLIEPIWLINIDENSMQEEEIGIEYFINKNENNIKIIKEIEFKIKIDNEKINLENIFNKLLKSKYIITDSYYITCLAILLNKKFLVINNDKLQYKRIENLLIELNLRERLISTYEEFNANSDLIFNDIEYETINKKINNKKIKSMNFIEKSLLLNNEEKKISDNDYVRIKLEQKIQLLEKKLKYLPKIKKIKLNHSFYSIIRNFSYGKKKEKINEKRNKYKKIIKLLEN